MSYYLKQISAKNFNVFDEVSFDFDENVNYLLSGENRDNKGQKKNGVGKSTFLQIIACGIIGNTIDDNSLKDFVGPFEKKGEIYLKFENKKEKEVFEIRRIFSKTDTELEVLVNGAAPGHIPTKQGTNGLAIDPGNEFILKHFQVTKEELHSFYLLSSKYYNSFLAATPAQMTKILNFIVSKDEAEAAMKELNREISELNGNLSSLQMLNENTKNSIQSLDQRITSLQEEEKMVNENLPDLSEKEAEIGQAEIQVQSMQKEAALMEVPANTPQLEREKFEAEQIKVKIVAEKSSVEAQRNNIVTCPNCQNEFSTVSKLSRGQIEEKVTEYTGMCSVADQEIQRLQSVITSNKAQEQKTNAFKQQLAANENFVAQKKLELANIKKLDNSGKIDEILITKKESLDQIEKTNQEVKELIDQVALKQDDYKKLDEFKFYLANKPIQQICSLTNYFLDKFKTDISMTIQGFKQNANGKIVAKLNPIAQMGSDAPKSFKLFSGGQRARMQVANDIAFLSILNSSKSKGGLSLYVSDEVSNGLDEMGIELICKSLQSAGITSLLVSHTANNLMVENEIKLVKENGKTFIKND